MVELQPEQADMLLPFEGMGVAGSWIFTMPKAANAFDYSPIADVEFTVEYSAIYSDEYYLQLTERLNAGRRFDGERAFSLRHHFADQWYEQHNPQTLDDLAARMRPVLKLTTDDFPPNLINGSLKISHLTIHVARKDGIMDEIEVSEVKLEKEGATVAEVAAKLRTRNGTLSSRDGAGTVWQGKFADKEPIGDLSFKLGGSIGGKSIDEALRAGDITDILVAIAVRGDLPLWPTRQ